MAQLREKENVDFMWKQIMDYQIKKEEIEIIFSAEKKYDHPLEIFLRIGKIFITFRDDCFVYTFRCPAQYRIHIPFPNLKYFVTYHLNSFFFTRRNLFYQCNEI